MSSGLLIGLALTATACVSGNSSDDDENAVATQEAAHGGGELAVTAAEAEAVGVSGKDDSTLPELARPPPALSAGN